MSAFNRPSFAIMPARAAAAAARNPRRSGGAIALGHLARAQPIDSAPSKLLVLHKDGIREVRRSDDMRHGWVRGLAAGVPVEL